jgi:ATP-binding cassette subfamily F protein 3
MSLIIGENISKAFGEQEVLKGVSFHLGEDDRAGLVGPNGEGKTTLLRIIAGVLETSSGQVHRSKGLQIGYLPQDPPALEDTTIMRAMLDAFADVRRMEEELGRLAGEMASRPEAPELLKRYGATQAEFEARGGYEYHRKIEQVLEGLAFERGTWERPLAQLSGGQRTKAHLAQLLVRQPEVLLLDEPTNHLDLDSVEWLEGWLGGFEGAMIVVSHDRYFLDHVTNDTWEVSFGGLEAYRGAYSEYVKKRAARHEERMRQWEAQQKYIDETQDFIRKYLAGQRSKEAKGRRTRLERFIRDEAVEKPMEHERINVALRGGKRAGDLVLRAEDLAVGYEPMRPLVEAERLGIERGQRIAIVGANGIGKTTLLKTLIGEMAPLGGSVKVGANVSFGYLSQTHAELDPEVTAFDAVLSAAKGLTAERVRSLLGSLLLSGDDAFKKAGDLSGGERSRVILARLVVQSANVLVLDEPTNHLDIPSTEIMEDVLRRFDGTVIFVSHDRYLIQAVATHIWAVEDQGVRVVLGGWEDYLKWRGGGEDARAVPHEKAAAKAERKGEYEAARKRANELKRLKRRHEEIEADIEKTEAELARLNQAITIAGEAGDVNRVYELGREHQKKDDYRDALWREWEEVGAKLE